jgi:Zn-dependent metalloprotease
MPGIENLPYQGNPYEGYNDPGTSFVSDEEYLNSLSLDELPKSLIKNVFIYSIGKGLICKDESCIGSVHHTANQMYATIQKIYQFFDKEFFLYGIDNHGHLAPIYLTWNENNTSWTCSSHIDRKSCFWIFTNICVTQSEVIAHEYTHAIISSLRFLYYKNESGALNESLADVFFIAFKHWQTPNTLDWTIGDRDLSSHPGKFRITSETPSSNNDYGYVHSNSAIPNHAFYIATKTSDFSLSLIAKIWLSAFLKSNPDETFAGFARKTVKIASQYSSELSAIIDQSWKHVGVYGSIQ